MKKLMLCLCCLLLTGLPLAHNPAAASELIWKPINPSFIGGDPLNGAFLLNEAQLQNDKTLPKSTTDALSSFNDTLNRQLLYQLSSKIVRAAFGESGLNPGHYVMGTFTVDIATSAGGISVSIVDSKTGGSTTVEVPYY
jgi:curli production assembly/transport component CsgF